jgi:tRNA U34 5-carboxymethylaminomethyl modifying GTPase MnmE/TrmE
MTILVRLVLLTAIGVATTATGVAIKAGATKLSGTAGTRGTARIVRETGIDRTTTLYFTATAALHLRIERRRYEPQPTAQPQDV